MNYTKEDKGGARMQAPLCDKAVYTDLNSDYTLPDYMPEIKRLLRVRATVSPADKYVGGGSADFSGNVDYCVLYSGNDGELYCVTEREEYRFSAPLESAADFEVSDGVVSYAETAAESVTGRVAAPRRLTVRCRLRSQVRVLGTKLLCGHFGGAPEDTVQKLSQTVKCARTFCGTGDPLTLEDEILPETRADDLRVVSAEAQVFVSEAAAGSETVDCRGDVSVRLICARDGSAEAPTVQWKKIPFSASVPVDGAEVNCEACAHGVCTDLAVTVEDGKINCAATIRLQAYAQRNEELTVTKDAYSTAADGETHTAVYAFPQAIRCLNGNFSLNGTLPLSEAGIRPEQTILDVSATPAVQSVETENGKQILAGRCRVSTVLSGDGDINAQEFDLPFRYRFDAPGTAKSFDAAVDVISCRARSDGERVSVEAELAVCLSLRGEESVTVLTDADFNRPLAEPTAPFVICYPSPDDTLWSVCKRYHQPVDSIAAKNNLPDVAADSLSSVSGIVMI